MAFGEIVWTAEHQATLRPQQMAQSLPPRVPPGGYAAPPSTTTGGGGGGGSGDDDEVLPAQVARSTRRRSTSRLHERARHVWRRGIVKRLLRYRLEGHFRSQSFISRILIDATP